MRPSSLSEGMALRTVLFSLFAPTEYVERRSRSVAIASGCLNVCL